MNAAADLAAIGGGVLVLLLVSALVNAHARLAAIRAEFTTEEVDRG